LYAHVIPVHLHAVQESSNLSFHLIVVVEALSRQMFFQLWKEMVVTGRQVRTIGWMGDDAPSKLLQLSDGLSGSMENAYALAILII
jgi:hypothetical protein